MSRSAVPCCLAGALEEVRRVAGSSAVILDVARLEGGQHAGTWRVDTDNPAFSAVVRQFPIADPAARHEHQVLRTLDGLDGLAPILLGGDLDGQWSEYPTSLISRLDGEADITPERSWERWARELGRALALVHAVPGRAAGRSCRAVRLTAVGGSARGSASWPVVAAAGARSLVADHRFA